MSSKPSSKDKAAAAKAKEEAAKAKEEAAKAKEELVSAMPDNGQADLLSQALLREYMHRKGFKQTLAAFDKENPRTETTINSREFMNSLMSTHFIQKRNSIRQAPLATIMEVLCSYRLRKRTLRAARGMNGPDATSASASASYELCGPEGETFDSSDEEGELHKEAEEHAKAVEERMKQNALLEEDYRKQLAAAAEKPKKEKKKDKQSKESKVGKKDKAPKKGQEEAAPVSSGPPVRRQFDPLGFGGGSSNATSSTEASSMFPVSSSGKSHGVGGSKWAPGGQAPAIGISSSSASLFNLAPAEEDDPAFKRPSFVAGQGFKLSTDNTSKVSSVNAQDVWGDKKGSAGIDGSPSGHRSSIDRDEPVPSPYANLGAVRFDASANAKSVLVSSSSRKFDAAGTASAASKPVGRRITWGNENSQPESSISEGGSPVVPQPAKVGFGFNSSNSPPNNNRARRTVTIIDQ